MSDLATIFANLQRYHIATEAMPLPPAIIGVTWIWAGNGVWKRGVDAHHDILIRIVATTTPGLALLTPHVRLHGSDVRIPRSLLECITTHARARRGIEQQYFILWEADRFRVWVPPQEAHATRLRYTMPDGVVALDLHSHHTMKAYFSPTDDRDDTGLGVSAVIGRIDRDPPALVLRANVYGQHQRLPISLVVDGFPMEVSHADASY